MKVAVKDQSCFIPVEGDWGIFGGIIWFSGGRGGGGHQSLLTGRDFKKLTAN